jgi:hypothetical protein
MGDAVSIVLYVAELIFLGCWVYVNMVFLQAHQEILKKLVDLIGITSIMEVCFYFLLDFSWYREDCFELRFKAVQSSLKSGQILTLKS